MRMLEWIRQINAVDPSPNTTRLDNPLGTGKDSENTSCTWLSMMFNIRKRTHIWCETSRLHTSISSDGERTSSLRLPDILLIVIVFGSDHNFVSNQVCRVKSHSKLSNHADIRSSRECLHEWFSSWSCNCSKIVHQIWITGSQVGLSQMK